MIIESLPEVEPILTSGQWEVRELTLTVEKVQTLWGLLQQYKTLFSDLTRGDFRNYFAMITQKHTLWFEVAAQSAPSDIIGLIWLTDLDSVIDGTAHMVFFDRQPSEKVDVCRALIKWVFERWPLQRVTVMPPEMYYVTHRLLEKIGFKREGLKREAVLINGKWNGVRIYGMVRSEVEALP